MMKIDWKQKLTSRKFWAAVIGFVTALLTAFNVDSLTIEQVTAIISATAVLIAYIIGEGLVDSARVKNGEPVKDIVVTLDGNEVLKALSAVKEEDVKEDE